MMRFTGLLVAATLLAAPTLANAAPIIWVDDSSGNVGTVDIATGTSTVVGPAGVVLTDIAFDPSQNLYGINFGSLYTVNQITGAATLVGAFIAAGDINGLAFGSDGTLYGSALSGNLYNINTATGVATLIGSTGFTSAGDLAFYNGTLYESVVSGGVSKLISVNPATAASTLIGTIVGDPNLYGLVAASDGLLYGVDGTNVYVINTGTGAGTLVIAYGGPLGFANGAASPTEAEAVPEPGSLALLAIGVLSLLGFAMARRRADA